MDCVEGRACTEAKACAEDQECAAIYACMLQQCREWLPEPGCRAKCMSEHPGGLDKLAEYSTPASECVADCGWGSHWSCVGGVPPWPAVTPGKIEVDLYTFPVPRAVSVTACPRLGECTPPVITGENGRATLVVDRFNSFTEWHFEASGSDIVPAATFYEHPLAGARTTRPVLAPDLSSGTPIRESLGLPDDPSTGVVVANIADCLGTLNRYQDPADSTGPTVALDVPASGPYYGVLSPRVGVSGSHAWFFGVPPGEATVTVFDPRGRKFTSKEVQVRAGWLSYVFLGAPHWAQ